MEMPRFSVELFVAQRVIGGIHEKREGHLQGLNRRVRIDLEGGGGGLLSRASILPPGKAICPK